MRLCHGGSTLDPSSVSQLELEENNLQTQGYLLLSNFLSHSSSERVRKHVQRLGNKFFFFSLNYYFWNHFEFETSSNIMNRHNNFVIWRCECRGTSLIENSDSDPKLFAFGEFKSILKSENFEK